MSARVLAGGALSLAIVGVLVGLAGAHLVAATVCTCAAILALLALAVALGG